jgi:hypothetical protein
MLFGKSMNTLLGPECSWTYAAHARGSKTATAPIYEPGSCDPIGGEQIGSVDLLGSTTFCCQL